MFVFLLILLVAIRKRDFAVVSTQTDEPDHEEPRIVDGFEAPDNSFRYQISLAKNNEHLCG